MWRNLIKSILIRRDHGLFDTKWESMKIMPALLCPADKHLECAKQERHVKFLETRVLSLREAIQSNRERRERVTHHLCTQWN